MTFPGVSRSLAWPRASLPHRYLANAFDITIILLIPDLMFVLVYSLSPDTDVYSTIFSVLALTVLVAWLYDAGFHSSRYMATPGKMLSGIKVIDRDGWRISLWQATVRFIVKFSLLLVLPFNFFGILVFVADALVMFTNERRRCLHDLLAGTLVIQHSGDDGPVPAGKDSPDAGDLMPLTVRLGR